MDSALQTSGNMLDRVTLTLTRRDVALMNLCLGVVARDRARGGNMRSDIESLRTLLTQVSPNTSQKKKAGCGSDCSCQEKEYTQRLAWKERR